MPTVKKQTKTGRSRATRGSILSRSQSVSEIEASPLRVCLYGPNRAGKTYLACQFVKPLLLVSFEPADSGGAESVRDFEEVEYLHFDSTDDAHKLADELRAGCDFKTVVYDSVTSLQDVVLTELLGLDELPAQLGWGTVSIDNYRRRSEITKELLRKLMNVPCDVVVTAKEKDHNPPKPQVDERGNLQLDMRPKMVKPLDIESFIGPEVGGATAGWLLDNCDYIFRIYMDKELEVRTVKIKGKERKTSSETGRFIRHLLVQYHPNYAGGCRLGATRDNLPEEGIITAPTYAKLARVVFGRESTPRKKKTSKR